MFPLHLADGEEAKQVEYVFEHDLRCLHEEQPGLFFGAPEHSVFVDELVRGFRDFQGVLGENARFVAGNGSLNLLALLGEQVDEAVGLNLRPTV